MDEEKDLESVQKDQKRYGRQGQIQRLQVQQRNFARKLLI
jgi:hypothetical protein